MAYTLHEQSLIIHHLFIFHCLTAPQCSKMGGMYTAEKALSALSRSVLFTDHTEEDAIQKYIATKTHRCTSLGTGVSPPRIWGSDWFQPLTNICSPFQVAYYIRHTKTLAKSERKRTKNSLIPKLMLIPKHHWCTGTTHSHCTQQERQLIWVDLPSWQVVCSGSHLCWPVLVLLQYISGMFS